MKVCIPTEDKGGMNGTVCGHFGRAPTFTIIDTVSDNVKVVPNRSEHMGGIGLPPEHLAREGVEVMLCSGMGPKAITMFDGFGIKVYMGASGTVRQTLEHWKQGKLEPASDSNACSAHSH